MVIKHLQYFFWDRSLIRLVISNWTSVDHMVIKKTNVILIERGQLPYWNPFWHHPNHFENLSSSPHLNRLVRRRTRIRFKEPGLVFVIFKTKNLNIETKVLNQQRTLLCTLGAFVRFRPKPISLFLQKTKDNNFGFLRKWNFYSLYFWLGLQVSTTVNQVDGVKWCQMKPNRFNQRVTFDQRLEEIMHFQGISLHRQLNYRPTQPVNPKSYKRSWEAIPYR